MEDKRVKLHGIQRKVAQHMLQSKNEIPHVTTIREVRMDKVAALRGELNRQHPDKKVSFMPFIMCAALAALRRFPVLNASLEGDEIVYHGKVGLGVAVTVGENLVVPVLHDADGMDFDALCEAFFLLTARARDGQLKAPDFRGGTFTISNSGALGGEIFTPIINYPESAILGVGRIRNKPIVEEDGSIVACPMMYLCLSYDHRIINGSQAVQARGVMDEYLRAPRRCLEGANA